MKGMRKKMNDKILQKDHETVIGKIIYLSDKEDRKGQERGREYFICLLYTSPRPRDRG